MVNLVVTQAPLLSGALRDCAQLENFLFPDDVPIDDSICSTGGLAAVNALNRMYLYNSTSQVDTEQSNRTQATPSLVIPLADFKSPLTIMSRFGFGVNTMIFGELGFRTWTLPAYTLWPGRIEEHAVYHLQDPDLPALLSNVVTSPAEAAHPYIESIYFDEDTKLAIIYLTKEYLENTHSQILSAQRLLQFIYKRNQAQGCDLTNQPTGFTVPRSGYSAFRTQSFSEWYSVNPEASLNASFPQQSDSSENCFLPVIILDDEDKFQYTLFIESLLQPNQPEMGDGAAVTLRPHLLVDFYGHGLESDETVILVDTLNVTQGLEGPKTWIVSYVSTTNSYHQIEMTIATNNRSIEDVSVIYHDLTDLPSETATSMDFYADLAKLRQYAREAIHASLVNEPGVSTETMPAMTETVDGYRRCYVGECELGNLVADAIRWADDVDVALVPSFMLDGPGWAAGEIRTLELLENIPYTVPRCNATLNGNSLLRILQHSISLSSFGPYDDVQEGGRLLQVSGLRLVYNNELESETGAITSVDVWDREQGIFLPLNRTRLYTMTSCNHLCFTFQDYPDYLGTFLIEEGEVPALAEPDSEIKTDVKEYLLAKFYEHGETYQPRLEGRMFSDTSSTNVMVVEERYNCLDGESYWDPSNLFCAPCPTYDRVRLSESRAELVWRAHAKDPLRHHVILMNGEDFTIQVSAEDIALPDYMQLVAAPPKFSNSMAMPVPSNYTNDTVESSPSMTGSSMASEGIYALRHNETLLFEVIFDASKRNLGTDSSSLVFNVRELDRSGNCTNDYKMKYDIVVRLDMSIDMNTLNGVAYFGYISAAVIILTSLFFASWVHYRRKTRVVSAMQPFFLITLCFGVALIGSSLIPLSIDDGVASQRGCDIACMFRPWLLSLGFTISVAALYSKLSRINRLFHSEQFRRVKVREKDVIFPTVVIILFNLIFLVVWTIKDPIHWERIEVPNQPWSTYGKCSVGTGNVAKGMLYSTITLCGISFIMTVWQAFEARTISSEFSESKYLGVAVFSWVQLLLVGAPVSFLVEDDNVVARYSLVVGLLIAVCMSMLLVVFVPMFLQKQLRESRRSQMIVFQGVGQNHPITPNMATHITPSDDLSGSNKMRNGDHQDTGSSVDDLPFSVKDTSCDPPVGGKQARPPLSDNPTKSPSDASSLQPPAIMRDMPDECSSRNLPDQKSANLEDEVRCDATCMKNDVLETDNRRTFLEVGVSDGDDVVYAC